MDKLGNLFIPNIRGELTNEGLYYSKLFVRMRQVANILDGTDRFIFLTRLMVLSEEPISASYAANVLGYPRPTLITDFNRMIEMGIVIQTKDKKYYFCCEFMPLLGRLINDVTLVCLGNKSGMHPEIVRSYGIARGMSNQKINKMVQQSATLSFPKLTVGLGVRT
jgi:hypothetical protein